MIWRGKVEFFLLLVYLIQVGLLFASFALEGALGGPLLLVIGLACIEGDLLAGPGEQLRRIA